MNHLGPARARPRRPARRPARQPAPRHRPAATPSVPTTRRRRRPSTSVTSATPTPSASPRGCRWPRSSLATAPFTDVVERRAGRRRLRRLRPCHLDVRDGHGGRRARCRARLRRPVRRRRLGAPDLPPSGTYLPGRPPRRAPRPGLAARLTLPRFSGHFCAHDVGGGTLTASGQGEQLGHALLEQIGHQPDVGDEVAVADEAEVEVAVVALHGDVEARRRRRSPTPGRSA